MENHFNTEFDLMKLQRFMIMRFITIRVKDEDGNWSSTFSKIVLVHASIDSRDILIQEAEYFWNEDPGEGLGTTVLAFDGDFNKSVEQLFVGDVESREVAREIVGEKKQLFLIMDVDRLRTGPNAGVGRTEGQIRFIGEEIDMLSLKASLDGKK